jgi:hypothetical protein
VCVTWWLAFHLISPADRHDKTAPEKCNQQCDKTVGNVCLHSKEHVRDGPAHAYPNKGSDSKVIFHPLDESSNKVFLGLEGLVDNGCSVERRDHKAAQEEQDTDSHDGCDKAPNQGNNEEFLLEENIVSVHGGHDKVGSQGTELNEASNDESDDETVKIGPLRGKLLHVVILLVVTHHSLNAQEWLVETVACTGVGVNRPVIVIIGCHFLGRRIVGRHVGRFGKNRFREHKKLVNDGLFVKVLSG